jgi:hypothetical protein
MAAIPPTHLDCGFARRLEGSPCLVRPTPQARNSTARQDRPGCCGRANCIPVWPVQAKCDATVHVERALAVGPALFPRTIAVAVETGPDRRAASGVPLPRIALRIGDCARAGLAAARAAHAELLATLGATRISHAERIFGAGHIIGTLRMGTGPRSAVVDTQLRSFDHPNLFLVGSGIFPASATANPTRTIAALSPRAVAPVLETLCG